MSIPTRAKLLKEILADVEYHGGVAYYPDGQGCMWREDPEGCADSCLERLERNAAAWREFARPLRSGGIL